MTTDAWRPWAYQRTPLIHLVRMATDYEYGRELSRRLIREGLYWRVVDPIEVDASLWFDLGTCCVWLTPIAMQSTDGRLISSDLWAVHAQRWDHAPKESMLTREHMWMLRRVARMIHAQRIYVPLIGLTEWHARSLDRLLRIAGWQRDELGRYIPGVTGEEG